METPPVQVKPFQFKFSKIIKYLFILIPLAIAGNIIYIIVGTKHEILAELGNFNIFYLALAVFLAFVPWVTQSVALILWSSLFKKRLAPMQAFKTVMATELGGAIAPVIVGGGYVKLGLLVNYGFAASEATMITFLGTFADGAFFLLTLPLALVISGAWSHPVIKIIRNNLIIHWRTVAVIVIVILIVILILRKLIWANYINVLPENRDNQKVGLSRLWFKIQSFVIELFVVAGFVARKGKRIFAAAVGVLGIGWCCRYCAVSALVFGLGYHANPVLFFLLQWVVFSASTLIPSPGGIGSAELSFALVYNGLVPSGLIPILTGAWRFVTFYMLIALDALMLTYMGFGLSHNKRKNSFPDINEEITV
jgi:uncharacterized protein (TIRG00374 family)